MNNEVGSNADAHMHKVKLDGGIITLDGSEIKGLRGYEIKKSSVTGLTELVLRIDVE